MGSLMRAALSGGGKPRQQVSPASTADMSTSTSASFDSHRRGREDSITTSTTDVSIIDGQHVMPAAALDPSHMGLDERAMSAQRWYDLAFALGIPAADDHRPNVDARKFAGKINKRRNVNEKQMTDAIFSLTSAIAQAHPDLKILTKAPFFRDAVPEDVFSADMDRPWKIRLPTPKPTFAVGYTHEVFDSHRWELQQGIISDRRGEPRDLSRISQTAPGIFWPFFVVDVQNQSMLATRNACAGATATCNNALMMLAGAMVNPSTSHYDEVFLHSLSRAVHSFSLAISGKTACLMTHNSEGALAQAVGTIRSYQLDNEKDVEALAARIKSIFVWASHIRLPAIMELLDKFDRRVRFRESVMAQETLTAGPMDLVEPTSTLAGGARTKRRTVLKTAIEDSLPAWTRITV